VVTDAQGVCHNRERRIDGAARREETSIDDVQVVELVRFAISVQRRGGRVVAETNRAVLVCDPGQRNALADE
jgi:hypothetical protein